MKKNGNLKVEQKLALKTGYSFEGNFFAAKRKKGSPYSEVQSTLDLKDVLAPVPKDHYLVRVAGDSMIDEEIYHGDLLIVNKHEKPTDKTIVIASVNGELLVKTYRIINNEVYLFSANKRFLPIRIMPFWEFSVQGVVKHIIRELDR